MCSVRKAPQNKSAKGVSVNINIIALKRTTILTSKNVLKIPPFLAPYKVAVLPLIGKDGLPEKANEILKDLKFDFECIYDEKNKIGKRYRKQDAIGTPFCITVDHQTLQDNTVTLRERDSMSQERIEIKDLAQILSDSVSMKSILKKLN